MKFVTFGEIMLRLSPPGYNRFLQTPILETCFGGSEANVALSLACFGTDTAVITALPRNEIGDACINELRSFGTDTSFIVRGGERMGIYFLEKGAGLRAGKVIYDRKNSSFAASCSDDYDFGAAFENCGWFHFSGITPALGQNLSESVLAALKEAKKRKITVSCDLNYRSKLWSREEAGKVMTALMPYVDVLIANDGSVFDVFGLKADSSLYENGEPTDKALSVLSEMLIKKFSFSAVALTARESISASFNNWSAMLKDKDGVYYSSHYSVDIVDRVGAGDAFAAGLIYKMMNNAPGAEAIEFAAAAGALKHTVNGDYNRVSIEETERVCGGNTRALGQR